MIANASSDDHVDDVESTGNDKNNETYSDHETETESNTQIAVLQSLVLPCQSNAVQIL